MIYGSSVPRLRCCQKGFRRRALGGWIRQSARDPSLGHLLDAGFGHHDGGERGGLGGVRGIAEGLSILETGREGAETGVPAAVAIVGWGGGGNLAAALEAAEQVATTAMVL